MPVKIYTVSQIVSSGQEIEILIGLTLLMWEKPRVKYMSGSIDLMLGLGSWLEFSSGMQSKKISMSLTTIRRWVMRPICLTVIGGATRIMMKHSIANL